MRRHAHGGCVDEPARVAQPVAELFGRRSAYIAFREAGVDGRGEIARALLFEVDDRQSPSAELHQGMRDCRTRTSGADQDDRIERRVRQAAHKRLAKAEDVGVVAGRSAVVEDDGVHGAECNGPGGEIVEPLEHELLARVRDVQAAEAEALCVCEKLADRARVEIEVVEIDHLVDVTEPEAVRRGLVQGGAQRRADAGADKADDAAAVRRRHRGHPRRRGIAGRSSIGVRTSTLSYGVERRAPTRRTIAQQ